MPCSSRIGVPAASTSPTTRPRWTGGSALTAYPWSEPARRLLIRPRGYIVRWALTQAASRAAARTPRGVSQAREGQTNGARLGSGISAN